MKRGFWLGLEFLFGWIGFVFDSLAVFAEKKRREQ